MNSVTQLSPGRVALQSAVCALNLGAQGDLIGAAAPINANGSYQPFRRGSPPSARKEVAGLADHQLLGKQGSTVYIPFVHLLTGCASAAHWLRPPLPT